MSLLQCKNVSMGYEGQIMLQNVNFQVSAGDYLCIVGENGSGKSTLLKGLLKLKSLQDGEITLGDGLVQKEIGYLPQRLPSQKNFPASVYEIVLSGRLNQLGFCPFYRKIDKKIVREKMEWMGIWDLSKRNFADLSGGQQQRVMLARALCATSKLLVLDEPVTGLDPLVTKEMYDLILKINREQKITIIMVSHDTKVSMEHATHILHLGKEQLFFGTTKEYENSAIGQHFLEMEGLGCWKYYRKCFLMDLWFVQL